MLVGPEAVAPAKVYLARLGNIPSVVSAADNLYQQVTESGISVLYDDRDLRPGEKFADAELIGIPHRVVISEKTLESQKVEYKSRTEDGVELIETAALLKRLV